MAPRRWRRPRAGNALIKALGDDDASWHDVEDFTLGVPDGLHLRAADRADALVVGHSIDDLHSLEMGRCGSTPGMSAAPILLRLLAHIRPAGLRRRHENAHKGKHELAFEPLECFGTRALASQVRKGENQVRREPIEMIAERVGFEPTVPVRAHLISNPTGGSPTVATRRDYRQNATDHDSSLPAIPARSPEPGESAPPPDAVDEALATGLAEAARAGRWDVVTALSRELELRRLARVDSKVVPLRATKRADGK